MQPFFAPAAWVNGSWERDVLLAIGADGCWSGIVPGASADAARGAQHLPGPVLPGLVDAHSHAFQRAIAGLTERREADGDDFWRWRERMYRVANRITPDQLEAVATFLYAELGQAGYSQVCEFHYLHGDAAAGSGGTEMALALVRAARRAGIGLTLLPALYMRSGFGAPGLRAEQGRFASTPESVLRLAEAVQREAAGAPAVRAGVAVHSLRAVDPVALRELAAQAHSRGWPVHIHVAEQQQEVDDCLAHTGLRPVEWLLAHVPVDRQWSLVHATHTTPQELRELQRAGAGVVLCPSTEANLGDGVFDLPACADAGGRWSIGSDSHVTRSWQEELRLLEYSQRLRLRRRNVAAHAGQVSSAAALFEGALRGGANAAGRPLGGLTAGQRADFMVVDPAAAALAGIPGDHLLDALVFSSPAAPLLATWVGGHRLQPDDAITERFSSAMGELT